MARRWVVLTAARADPVIAANTIVEYTEWAGRNAAADEVIYTDPVDASDDPVDGSWKVGGLVTLAGTTYTYTDPSGQFAPDDITADAGRKRAAVRAAYEELRRLDAGAVAKGSSQTSANRALVRDGILGQLKALYLRAANSQLTVAAIESYCEQVARGPSDVTGTQSFYRVAAGLNKGTWVDGDPLEWATIAGAVATRRGFQASITAAPADFRAAVRDFSAIDLSTDAWIEAVITL